MSYVNRLSKGLLRSISLALLLALVLNIASVGIVRADDPTWTQTSQADFELGTRVNVNTTSSPGDVMLALNPAGEQLDQNNPNSSDHWHEAKDEKWCAQSFIAGITGNLTKVALYLKKSDSPGQLTIEIRNATGVDYRPGSTVYASLTTSAVTSTTGQEYQFNFPSPAAVTSGTHYAIVLNEPTGMGDSGKYYWDEYTPSDIYPNGNVWRSSDSGSSWSVGGGGVHDFYFKTYVSGTQYYSSGTLTSSTHDTGYAANFGTISWTETTPSGTSINFQIATNNDNSTWSFKGPDGTSGTYYTSSGTSIWTGHDGDRYIKYKAFLSTTDNSKTPTLHDVSITYAGGLPPPPPASVGGEIHPVNKAEVLASSFVTIRFLMMLLFPLVITGGIRYIRQHRDYFGKKDLKP